MRMTFALAVACLTFGGLAAAGDATAAIRQPIDIPAEGLAPALRTLAKAFDFQVLYRTEVVGKLRTDGVSGAMTASEALDHVLTGTGLTYKYLDDKTVTIIPISTGDSGQSNSANASGSRDDANTSKEAGKNTSQGFRVAQLDQGKGSIPSSVGERISASSDDLQEIVVTAQKRRQREFDVPVSLDVMTGEELQQRGITNLEELAEAVPGMHVQGGVQPRIFLRGISNWAGNGVQVGQYLDDADITTDGFAGTNGYGTFVIGVPYDLARVEVLRGPQGTLYGEGAEGGTIRFITNSPVLDRFQMSADVATLFTQYGAPSQHVQVMLNTPLIQETLGLRLAADIDHDGGWIDQPAVNSKNFNSQDLVNVRIEGLWKPTERLEVRAMQLIIRRSYGIPNGEDAAGNYTQYFNLTTTPHGDQQGNLSNLALTYDFGNVQLLNSATYFNHQTKNYYFGLEIPPSAPTPHFVSLFTNYPVKDSSFSDELRLSNTGAGPWQWTVGGFYKRYRDTYAGNSYFKFLADPTASGTTAPLPHTLGSFTGNTLSSSWSAFADTSYKFLDRLTIGAGARYFSNDYSAIYFSPYEKATFTSSDPRFYIQYQVNQQVNTYASAAKGFRSGGFNGTGLPAYGPESVWTYELGSKMRFLDGRLGIDADVFYTNYKNYDISGYYAATQLYVTENAGDAAVKGIEAQATWRLPDGWSFSLNGDYLDTYFRTVTAQFTGFAPGDKLPFVPKYGWTASMEREYRWNGKPGYARLDYNQVGRTQYRDPSVLGLEQSDVIHTLNFSADIQWNENLRLGISAQNLLNDRGLIDPFTFYTESTRPRPRTFGVNFGVKFE
jgi:iron complex outermembrane receptor protein